MGRPLRVLIVENLEDDALLMLDVLHRGGFDVTHRRVETLDEMRAAIIREEWDVILADYFLPGFTGLDALRVYGETNLDIPFLLVSGNIGEDIAVEAMRRGAHDYLLKDRLARLPVAIERELREGEIRRLKQQAEVEKQRQAEEIARKNEELTIKAEQLYRSNKDLERFAFVAAHDLQEPLRTVKTYSQYILKRYRETDKDLNEIVGFIEEGITRMEALIRGLLEYSRVTNNAEAKFSAVCADTVVDRVVRSFQERIHETGAVVSRDPMPAVHADATQLAQVFQNLLSNALKYRKADGTPHIHFSAAENDGHVVFSVADNGIGIAPEYFSRIFEIFRRLHRTEYPGIGIGLALAKRLVENQGGRIWVESKPGEGATFFFSVPAAQGRQASATFG